MRNSLQRYTSKVAGKNIDMDGVYGSQCVDLIKHYTINVMNISIGTFGGSAKTGWANESNTFPEEDWIKIENDYSNPDQIPDKGDIIFFGNGQYGHVGIILKAYPGENKIKILSQNTGNADGYGKDDVTKVEYYTYNDVLGWYSSKRFLVEYKGLPVFIRKQPSNKPNTNASYYRLRKYIVLYERFFTKNTTEHQAAILEHEYAHHIWYHKVPGKIQRLWTKISNYDTSIQETLEMFYGDKYTGNAYVTNYAEKNIKEDFAECWETYKEFGKPGYGDYRDVKVNVVIRIMNKYT